MSQVKPRTQTSAMMYVEPQSLVASCGHWPFCSDYASFWKQDTLKYSCVCSNGQSPNASEYTETIPFFLCTEQNTQCVNDCTQNNSSCQDKCRSSNPCGAQNPRPPNKTATTAASTTSTLPPFTGEASDEGGAIKPMIDLKPVYGLSIVLGGFFAGFAFFL